ncbi:MAG: cohesin domain-containing protein [Candidatus Pacebacteria bacterium]|nr:cohesin domain-containing protein [Candidatus Paceibacterota bacterium]
MKNKNKIGFLILFFLCVSATKSEAAVLYAVSKEKNFGIGSEFEVSVKINSGEEAINASQGKINFPADILEVVSVSSKESIFNFWLEEPGFSNETGIVSFAGGTPKGTSGNTLQVLDIKFKAKGAGTASLGLSEAVVTANDGKGTNVLSEATGLDINISTKISSSQIVSEPIKEPITNTAPEEQVQIIERVAEKASKLPIAPEVRVPFYPDSSKWYNYLTWDSKSGKANAFWDVPDDITAFAFQIDTNPNSDPKNIENQLYTGKAFSIFEEGIWYIHVKFKNSVGWGPITHYKISIDTTAPLPFEVEIDSLISQNPTPKIVFVSQDSLSGISGALIVIDKENPIGTEEGVFDLPIQSPGKHSLLVKIFDKAGNGVEDNLEYEILPLPTPTLEFSSSSVEQGQTVFASGKSEPGLLVNLKIKSVTGEELFFGSTNSDSEGDWKAIIDKNLPVGNYFLSAKAINEKGASSFESELKPLRVRAKVILSLGLFDLTWLDIFIIIISLILSGIGFTSWWLIKEEKRRGAYLSIAGRDVEKLANLVEEEINKLDLLVERKKSELNLGTKNEVKNILEKVKNNAEKMKKYIKKELEDVND